MILFQFVTVCTRTHIISFCPGSGYQFYQIMISFLILSQHNQVPTALVGLTFFLIHGAACYIHLTTDYRLEQLIFRFRKLRTTISKFRVFVFASYLTTFNTGYPLFEIFNLSLWPTILLVNVICELFNAEHITVVSHGYPFHSILHSLVHQRAYAGLTIEEGVLGMNVQMNKILHKYLLSIESIKVQRI